MNYNMEECGNRIQQLRIQHEYTQESLANKLCIDRSLLSYIESGKKGCSVDLLIQLSEFFNVSLDYLILGIVHLDPSKADAKEHMGKKIAELICHLEAFNQALKMRCDE